jgi:hypothetical protein
LEFQEFDFEEKKSPELSGEHEYLKRQPIEKAPRGPLGWVLTDIFLIFIENLLAFRVVFRFLGLTSENPLVGSVYTITNPLVSYLNMNYPSLLSVSAKKSIFEGGTVIIFFVLYASHFLLNKFFSKKGSNVEFEGREKLSEE